MPLFHLRQRPHHVVPEHYFLFDALLLLVVVLPVHLVHVPRPHRKQSVGTLVVLQNVLDCVGVLVEHLLLDGGVLVKWGRADGLGLADYVLLDVAG